jgi:rhamnose utilization protein RhaD (predicted bifunctional aldolase and dehydrogenase)
MDIRAGEAINAFLGRDDLADLARRGVASPDHVIRTKGNMLVLGKDDLASGRDAIEAKVADYAAAYRAMFDTQFKRVGGGKVMLEPHPCVAWIEGVGIAGIGKDASAASAAADIAEQTVEVMSQGEAGRRLPPHRPG